MDSKELIQKARDAIGVETDDDWKIDPTKHAEDLKAEAPELAEHLLLHTSIKDTANQYKTEDERAGQAQDEFKNSARRANFAIFLTASLAVGITVAGSLLGKGAAPGEPVTSGLGATDWVFICLGITGLIASSLASMWLVRLRDGKKLESWMKSRAKAESRRLEYFDAVRTAGEQDNTYLELLKLGYFRRYLLGSQIRYFEKRGGEHENAAKRTLNISTGAMTSAAILTGAAGLLAAAVGEVFAAIGGLGVMATAFGAMYSAREGINQDRRNAHRYHATKDSLIDIRKRFMDPVEQAVSAGKPEQHVDFVNSVQGVLLDEHAQWLDSAHLRSAAVDRLERRLREEIESEEREIE